MINLTHIQTPSMPEMHSTVHGHVLKILNARV